MAIVNIIYEYIYDIAREQMIDGPLPIANYQSHTGNLYSL